MSIIDLACDVNDAVEPTVVAPGEEYQIRIIECEARTDRNGNPFLFPRFEVVDEPTAKDFTMYLGLPTGDMEPKKLNRTKLRLKNFFDAFGVDPAGNVDTDELRGLTAWAILGVEDNEQYGPSNYIKKFLPQR